MNMIIAGLLSAISFILKVIWDGLRELQKADVELTGQIGRVRLMMSDSYIKKEDFDRMANALFAKLDKIENKLDGKADKIKRNDT
ncbi:hypothetical protein [Candidatus Propionivibrio aalborgensis]|uniref:hypothetical protein n=1 Tax=Candidatus Propionivibrio aalborgensis TaxID=1860101 RepID=UPI0016441D5F|nr:hypothetical protein [Candidatus Propionivibrio aalborgensis]